VATNDAPVTNQFRLARTLQARRRAAALGQVCCQSVIFLPTL
jgi:hypothetical protein